jgi:hypothetical protein
MSPFDGVHWKDGVQDVEVGGTCYELIAINDVPIEKIVSYSQAVSSDATWQKHTDEDRVR